MSIWTSAPFTGCGVPADQRARRFSVPLARYAHGSEGAAAESMPLRVRKHGLLFQSSRRALGFALAPCLSCSTSDGHPVVAGGTAHALASPAFPSRAAAKVACAARDTQLKFSSCMPDPRAAARLPTRRLQPAPRPVPPRGRGLWLAPFRWRGTRRERPDASGLSLHRAQAPRGLRF